MVVVIFSVFLRALLSYNSPLIKFILYEVGNSEVFIVFTELQNHHLDLISEYFHDPENKLQIH